MAILKNKTQGYYVMVSQGILHDKELGISERGMLTTLLSLSDKWDFSIEGLQAILPDGKAKISRAINTLMEMGYLTKDQERDAMGHFASNIIEVHDVPQENKENQVLDEPSADLPSAGFPPTGFPSTVSPSAGNQPQVSIKEVSNKKVNNNKSNNQRSVEVDTLSDSDYQRLIEEFGKSEVDWQIRKIQERNYKGCMNYQTLSEWCEERRSRKPIPAKVAKSPGYIQNEYDFDELERELVTNSPPIPDPKE